MDEGAVGPTMEAICAAEATVAVLKTQVEQMQRTIKNLEGWLDAAKRNQMRHLVA